MTRIGSGLAVTTLLLLTATSSAQAGDDARARKMMEEAFNRRYRWVEGFKGFSADFTLTREGKTAKGTIKADLTHPHGGVEVTCDDEEAKKLVGDTLSSTVTHTRASSFTKGFSACEMTVAGDGAHGGTKIAVAGHGFFKDFTVKDGNIVENHGGHGEMSSEVKVRQVLLMVDSGKTLPREYAFTIKTGDKVQTGKTVETWREVDGVWLPTWFRLSRSEGTAPVESMLRLENVKVEQAPR